MKNVAIIIRGAVSKSSGKIKKINEIYDNVDYINFQCVYNSIKKHIIDVNLEFKFDFFIHSWSFDLENKLNSIYNPKLFLYENNSFYNDLINEKLETCGKNKDLFSQVSQSLSISKSCQIFTEYSTNNKLNYEYVILYRPDVIIWKDLKLNEYEKNNIYCNSFQDMKGDFHFVFTPDKIIGFTSLFDGISINNPPIPHEFIKKHLVENCKFNLLNDNIVAGQHQEVVRKLNLLDDKNFLTNYGITLDEIKSYNM
jgi:hypothetical protein